MISDENRFTSNGARKLQVSRLRRNGFETSTRHTVPFNQQKGMQERTSMDSNFRDDGYLNLAKNEGKTSQSLLLLPANSWPLRRKITEKELKEFGEKLDSGSTSLLDAKTCDRNSRQSVASHSDTLLIEQDKTIIPEPDFDTSSIEKCIDYCTCMCCVKSACYIIGDDQDDTGTPHYNPCYCSGPNKGCVSRWSLLGLLACFMPCLFCYPVARGCLNRHNRSRITRHSSKNENTKKRYRVRFSKSRQPDEIS